jgi:hypothetical protein
MAMDRPKRRRPPTRWLYAPRDPISRSEGQPTLGHRPSTLTRTILISNLNTARLGRTSDLVSVDLTAQLLGPSVSEVRRRAKVYGLLSALPHQLQDWGWDPAMMYTTAVVVHDSVVAQLDAQ